jgi:hypothetical protein
MSFVCALYRIVAIFVRLMARDAIMLHSTPACTRRGTSAVVCRTLGPGICPALAFQPLKLLGGNELKRRWQSPRNSHRRLDKRNQPEILDARLPGFLKQ